MRFEFDLDRLVAEVATRVATELADRIASDTSFPWMAMDEAIAYTRVPASTCRRKLFRCTELDAALGDPRRRESPIALTHRAA